MTIVSEIIEEAFREGNFIGENNSPTPKQAREALRSLNTLIGGLWGGEAGERLNDWPLGNFGKPAGEDNFAADCLARPTINRRLLATNDAAATVYLPCAPQDGSRMGIVDPFSRLAAFPVTLNANGRTIESTPTLVLNTDGLNREWVYRADLGGWLRISGLTAGDEMPFPAFFDDMFSVMLALRLAPRFGKEIAASSLAIMKKQHTEFTARYLQFQPLRVDDSVSPPFMSRQSYLTGQGFSSRRAFNRGNY